jgi:hypothetical protein
VKPAVEALLTLLFSIGTVLVVALWWDEAKPPELPPVPKPTGSQSATPAPEAPFADLPPLGPAFDSDESLAARAIPVADYTFDVTLDTDQHLVHGKGVIRWRNHAEREVRELALHLYANAFRSQSSRFLSDPRPGWLGRGAVRDYGHIDVEHFAIRQHGGKDLWPKARRADPTDTQDDTDMIVPLDRPIEEGDEVDIEVAWTTKLPSIVARMGYDGSFHMVAQWFPKLAKLERDGNFASFPFDRLTEFYADFGTYDVTMSVPSHFVVGATGPRISERVEGDRKVVRHVQSDIHDFAFVAWDAFRELRRDVDGTDVRVLFPPGHDAIAKEQLEVTVFGLRHFGRRYGAYPYPSLTIVHPPVGAREAGGMEYPTLITTGGPWWRRGVAGSSRALTLHELGHQYFHGLVATNENAWPFLDEGLTTFVEVDALQAGWGNRGAIALRSWGVAAPTVLRHMGVLGGQDDVIATSAPDFHSGYTYGRLVYSRAALVLETLDRVHGGRLQHALGRYARRYRFTHPGPDHLVGSVRDVLGDPAAEFLRTCLYDRGWIDVAIQDLTCAERTCTLVVVRRGNLEVPVDVRWIHGDGSETTSVWNAREASASLKLESTSSVVGAILDPDHKILIDEDFSNNAIRRDAQPRAWRTRGVLTFLASLVFFAGSP